MNHTKSQQSVFIPPPPALPQFDLDMDDEDDEDVIATTQRPTMDPVRAGRFARSSKPVLADGTSEVAVEDILLEAYVEVPPPPKTKRILTPPPSPAEGAALEAFLRAMPSPYVPYQAPRYDDSPSVAPIVMPDVYYPPSPPAAAVMTAPRSRAGLWVGLGLGLLALSAISAAGITLGLKKHHAVVASIQTEVVAPPPAHEPHSVPVTAPPPAPAPPPSMSVDALPKPAIAANQSLVTFPASAQGHRVFFDGTPMAVTAEPLLLRCGRHNVRIGSAGKVRVRDLACGQEVSLTR